MVGPDPHRPGPARGRLLAESVPVWAIVGYVGAIAGSTEPDAITDDVFAEVAEAYDVSHEAVQAALLYYDEHRCAIDALLEANAAALAERVADFRIVLDEDVSHRLARLLQSQGWDIDSAKELGRLRLTEVQVLLRAAEDGRTLVTHNIKDFRTLHEAWVTWRDRWAAEIMHLTGSSVHLSQHAGILIAPHLPDRDLARILEEFVQADEPMVDRLFSWLRVSGWQEMRFQP